MTAAKIGCKEPNFQKLPPFFFFFWLLLGEMCKFLSEFITPYSNPTKERLSKSVLQQKKVTHESFSVLFDASFIIRSWFIKLEESYTAAFDSHRDLLYLMIKIKGRRSEVGSLWFLFNSLCEHGSVPACWMFKRAPVVS